MTEHPDIAALAQVMAPTFGVDEALDWPSVEERLDCQLPSDYKAFMSLYGGGGIDDLLSVLLPLHEDGIQWDPGAIEDEISGARSTWEHTPAQWRPDLDPAHILPWGQTSGPDLLCWLTTPLTPTPTTGRSLSAAGTPTSAGPCSTAAWPDSSCGSSPLTSPLVP